MSIDILALPESRKTGTPSSEMGRGWLLANLYRELQHPDRVTRLDRLDNWYQGNPDLPHVPKAAREAVRQFHELAHTNFALLLAEAVRERQRVRGIRTAADDDATGDGEAWLLWKQMRMAIVSADIHRLKARFGTAYGLTSAPADDEPDIPIVTAEDPRNCIADTDPSRPWIARTGLKLLHDPAEQVTRAYLYRPGRVDVAYKETRSKTAARFDPNTWAWDETRSGIFQDVNKVTLPDLMPLIPYEALDGMGEFEQHLTLLRRINFTVLQQLTIAVLQAFRQRAIKGGLRPNDDNGNPIDYNAIFTADPGALWSLPEGAEIWESGQVDLSGIANMIRDDIRKLAAVSRTPLPMLDPSGENQSAEGAQLSHEGMVLKVEDRNSRDGISHAALMRNASQWLGRDITDVDIIWAPPRRASLAERGSALAQASAAGVPFATRMTEFGGFDPADVDRMLIEREDDLIFTQRAAELKAAASPAPTDATNTTSSSDATPPADEATPPATGDQTAT